ncbi:thiol:disulfide interchange protein DsbA/DsbL [Polynucleobacter sp. UB-Raua-W9]|jgi:thiol:disulfide interchange protein DsbA|uniref:thiol:disulfide interchange protein DsbA/DsbL n=1 Tax=Polynucleobacter sp. UB-Raua-W9 TaxID=1819736 RepID=UPI001BFEEAFD|nr:thiol:disulfide interchange protein DsbA/DsbL [Polynucleobacter sp. UB-Raua-W9]QWD72325.1 thiol:disulfide interchange protein DsbA/DsbL [Polynucleobacter sp. UB-Raua-W9]
MISFSKRAFTLLTLLCLSGLVGAQSQKIEEGFDYRILPIAQPVETKGKVEVIEFFWYGCPHCYDFEPELTSWMKRQPKDVTFRRVPVAFRDDFMPHSQLFYALEALGKGDALNEKVMYAMHKENKRLLTESEIADWVASQGIDRNTFLATYRSFAVASKARAAKQLAEAYRIDGVPTIVMQGKYVTSPSIAGTKAKAIAVMDYLEEKIRKNKYKQ